jgi:hypothetical protein
MTDGSQQHPVWMELLTESARSLLVLMELHIVLETQLLIVKMFSLNSDQELRRLLGLLRKLKPSLQVKLMVLSVLQIPEVHSIVEKYLQTLMEPRVIDL